MKYFSPSANDGRGAFFDDAIFGKVAIDVVDQAAQDAALAEAQRKDDADFTAARDSAADGVTVLRSDFQTRQRAVIGNPIMKTVPNPDCRLPTDCVAISDSDHAALMDAQVAGHEIIAGSNGLPIASQRIVTANDVLAMLRKARDAALAASDWTQLPDSALSPAKKKEWRAYRDVLRALPMWVAKRIADGEDIAAFFGAIDNILPTPPEAK